MFDINKKDAITTTEKLLFNIQEMLKDILTKCSTNVGKEVSNGIIPPKPNKPTKGHDKKG
jgi:hypothetical protein